MDVLLVEDEPATSALLQAVLECRGHTVTAVADGESGWKSYRSRHFSMVILDWRLPEMDGLEVCRKIRSSPNGADSVILVITLRTNPGDLKQILAAGADDYIAKPVDRPILNTRLEIAEQRVRSLMYQREIEEARAQAQTMFQLILDTIPSHVFWKNKESRYLGCNRLFAKDAGLQDPSQIIGKTDHELRWAKQAQHCISDDHAVMQSMRAKVNYKAQKSTMDGALMYREARRIPLMDRKGNLIGVLGTYQDITESKLSGAEIFAVQSKLAGMLDALPDLLFEVDLDGRYHDYHSSRHELLTAPVEKFIGKTVHEVLPPEAADVAMSALREANETGLSRGKCYELPLPQGPLWFELSIARKPVAAGLEPRFIVLSRDITERKRAENALRKSEDLLKESQRMTHIGSWELDLRNDTLSWSDECFRIFEIDPVRFGASYEAFLNVVHPDDQAMVDKAYTESLQNRTPYIITHRLLFPDQRVKFVHEWCETQYDKEGRPVRSIGTAQDITECKHAEERLRKSEERFRFLAENATDMVFRMSPPDGRYEYVSPASLKLFGYAPEEFYNSPLLIRNVIHPDWQAYFEERWAKLVVGEMPPFYEYPIIHRSGETRWMSQRNSLIMDGSGKLIAIQGVVTDITVRKQDEEEIRALNLSLEEQVRERTRELLAKEEQLRETLALNDSILMKSSVGIAAYRQDGQCVMANPALASIAGSTQEQSLKQNFRQLSAWQDSGMLEAAEGVLATGAMVEREVRYLTSFGRDVWALARLSRFTSRGEPHLLLMLENITEKKAAEEELRLAASVFKNSSEGILITDAVGLVLSVNPAFTEITGYAEGEALGREASLLRSDRHGPEFYSSMWDTLTKEGCWRGEIWNQRKSGEAQLVWLAINRINGVANTPFHYVAVFHDVTELRRKDEEIRHQAFHDALTGLPNRALMHDRLLHALERAKREGGRLSVTFIDLDRFKAINDGLGHDIGDLLLQEVARRIKSRMRTSDTVARLGGDEFVVLMEDLRQVGDSADLAQELIAEIARPMELSGHAAEISASMGIAFYPEDGTSPLELMKCADLAMYAAKSAGRNTYRFFQQDMQDQVIQRLNLEMELRLALAQRDLELYYQPKVDLATGKILGVEALLRWRHPQRGLLLPADFIPLAEECGLICELGDWVLDEVCRQSAAWKAAGHNLKIAFHVSAHQMEEEDLVARISELTSRHGIAPADLEIELTESAVMAYSKHAASVFVRLRGIGVTVAVGDFCAGYSSLAYLRQLPIDILKINHSFVTDADSNEEDAQIVKTILALGRMFKLRMEAEGVETSHQAKLLQSFGCGIAQGYFFSHPLPALEFEDWLNKAIDASVSRPGLE